MSEQERRTCNKIKFFRMNGVWWCRAPYDPTKLEQAVMTFGKTTSEAYGSLLSRVSTPGFVPPPDTPRSLAMNRQMDDAEYRQRHGLHRPWSSLDCAVRNGGGYR